MFTGIIQKLGSVVEIRVRDDGARLVVRAGVGEVRVGDSVAVNGVCLTAAAADGDCLAFDVVTETLTRTSLGRLAVGERVNLERPLRADGRFDGHLVQGHVDGTAQLESVVPEGCARRLRFRLEPGLLRYVVMKGSIAVDGISLTVAGLGPDWFEVAIIPHTWEATNLGEKMPGTWANIEVDILAKYVERLLERG